LLVVVVVVVVIVIVIVVVVVVFRVDLLPYDLITQLFKILSIETKQEKGIY